MPSNHLPQRLTTRRRLLAGVASATVGSVAGCLSGLGDRYLSGLGPRYRLRSSSESDGDPVELFTRLPGPGAFHQTRVEDDYFDSVLEKLHETGTMETIESTIVRGHPTGDIRFSPTYVETDDGYSRVRVNPESVTLDRWVVWMEPLTELPDNVEYVDAGGPESFPIDGLSELDAAILESAATTVVSSELADRDHTDLRFPRRGVVFFDPLSQEDSDLVPDPPFEYAMVTNDSEFSSEDIPMQLHVGEESVETTRYAHTLEPVASSREEFIAHVRDEHISAQFSSDELDEQKREILDESSAPEGYLEEDSRSDAYDAVLADLGLEDATLPDSMEIISWLRYYEYDGKFYDADYVISKL